MSGTRLFESFKRPATKTEIACHIAEETIREHRAARKGREDQPWDAHDTDRMQRLAALMVGPHQAAVTPVILKAYPQLAALINRKVGIVTGILEDMHVLYGTVVDAEGTAYRYQRDAITHDEIPLDARLAAHPYGARVSFRVSDDGYAHDIYVLATADVSPVGNA